MPTPSEKMAQSLEVLQTLQNRGTTAIQTSEIGRLHRERLIKNGFLKEVVKGWYIPTRPDEPTGESTAWYSSFWDFCAEYLNNRFGNKWCLSPEQSILLHVGNWTVPKQLLVRSPNGNNKITPLPHNTSLLDTRYVMPDPKETSTLKNLHLFSLASALITCTPRFFTQNPTDIRAALSMIRDSSEILGLLLQGGHTTVAGRLAGAFRNIGRNHIADDIIKTMSAAGYVIRETDPFENMPVLISSRERSPYVSRMNIMWQTMREIVIKHFPKSPTKPTKITEYLKRVEEVYATDAYNSLSIEGYHISAELIQQVRRGAWNPDGNEKDREQKSALAARGYWKAFQEVKESVHKVLKGNNAGKVAEEDHRNWYREMFAPCVTAGILKPIDLAGYRNGPVYIRHSMHTPPNPDAARDLMPAFFDLLQHEKEASVRSVLGHFFFVYIHPYMDGNGRIGRFLMNVMLASGGYPWTVVPLEKRNDYMAALEEASVRQNIKPFNDFIAGLVKNALKIKTKKKGALP